MKLNEFAEIVEFDDPGIEAAARVIFEAGRFHHWNGFNKPFEALDPIGRIEFLNIIADALDVADRVRKERDLYQAF
jgi:hypothetical protein